MTPKQQSARRSRLKRYGLSLHTYDLMIAQQQGTCAICSGLPTGNKPLAVDHDHETGKVRALLCDPCNTGLGLFREDIITMHRAIKYLIQHA